MAFHGDVALWAVLPSFEGYAMCPQRVHAIRWSVRRSFGT